MLQTALAVLLCSLMVGRVLATDKDRNQENDDHSDRLRDALDRPNFVVFFVDDLGYGDCGFTGHPTTYTPNIDALAYQGKILSTWYSACAVCSCSRASLMTGRQWPRTGVSPVFNAASKGGMNLQEVTLADQLKRARKDNQTSYTTAIVGKWHLGQRPVYLPGNRGFDYYLGVPYSDDMGSGLYPTCPATQASTDEEAEQLSFLAAPIDTSSEVDPAGTYIPLVYQEHNRTEIVEQPVNFHNLTAQYSEFATNFIHQHKEEPFFLYVPFSHVHTTTGMEVDEATGSNDAPHGNMQYASCQSQNCTRRGPFGDALADVDWIVGQIMDSLRSARVEENTLVLFTSDNGPWLHRGLDGGSAGLFTGRYAPYVETGKGSTWEGGIREPAFAYWKGQIEPFSRSAETVSTMDIFPTLSHLADVALPADRVYDGRNMASILLRKASDDNDAKSACNNNDDSNGSGHDFLFFYGDCMGGWPTHPNVTAVRHGPYKAHFCTGPGTGFPHAEQHLKVYHPYPLVFHVDQDPSEQYPLAEEDGQLPLDAEDAAAVERIMKAYAMERATFEYGSLDPWPLGPGEVDGEWGLCCDRHRDCFCPGGSGILNAGTRAHHDRYHEILGEENPLHKSGVEAS